MEGNVEANESRSESFVFTFSNFEISTNLTFRDISYKDIQSRGYLLLGDFPLLPCRLPLDGTKPEEESIAPNTTSFGN